MTTRSLLRRTPPSPRTRRRAGSPGAPDVPLDQEARHPVRSSALRVVNGVCWRRESIRSVTIASPTSRRRSGPVAVVTNSSRYSTGLGGPAFAPAESWAVAAGAPARSWRERPAQIRRSRGSSLAGSPCGSLPTAPTDGLHAGDDRPDRARSMVVPDDDGPTGPIPCIMKLVDARHRKDAVGEGTVCDGTRRKHEVLPRGAPIYKTYTPLGYLRPSPSYHHLLQAGRPAWRRPFQSRVRSSGYQRLHRLNLVLPVLSHIMIPPVPIFISLMGVFELASVKKRPGPLVG